MSSHHRRTREARKEKTQTCGSFCPHPPPYLPLTSSSQKPEARGAQRDLQGFSWAWADRVERGGCLGVEDGASRGGVAEAPPVEHSLSASIGGTGSAGVGIRKQEKRLPTLGSIGVSQKSREAVQSYLLAAGGDSRLRALQRSPWFPVLPSPLPSSPLTRKTCLIALSPHFL